MSEFGNTNSYDNYFNQEDVLINSETIDLTDIY